MDSICNLKHFWNHESVNLPSKVNFWWNRWTKPDNGKANTMVIHSICPHTRFLPNWLQDTLFFSKLQPWSWWFEVPGSTIVNTFASYTMWSLRSWQRSKILSVLSWVNTLKCFTRKRRCFHWCVRSKPLESYFLLWRSEDTCKEVSHQGAVSFPRVGT